MPRAVVRDPLYRGCRFPADVIEQCVRWYITYRLSHRDLRSILAEQGVQQWLYRAVDRDGRSVHSMLSSSRNIAAAQAFFQGAVANPSAPCPATVNIDGNAATLVGLKLLARDDPRWRNVQVRENRYVNNLIEQDHRAVKRRSAAMHGLNSFNTAAITLAGVELTHRIRKRQYDLPVRRLDGPASLKDSWQCALGAMSERSVSATADLPLTHQFSATHSRRARRRLPF